MTVDTSDVRQGIIKIFQIHFLKLFDRACDIVSKLNYNRRFFVAFVLKKNYGTENDMVRSQSVNNDG
jgi:hypothetical protein